jgi:hypothetical protein
VAIEAGLRYKDANLVVCHRGMSIWKAFGLWKRHVNSRIRDETGSIKGPLQRERIAAEPFLR